jgi:hypothetical protein
LLVWIITPFKDVTKSEARGKKEEEKKRREVFEEILVSQ